MGTESGAVLEVSLKKKKDWVTSTTRPHYGPVTGLLPDLEVSCGADWSIRGGGVDYDNGEHCGYSDIASTGTDNQYIWASSISGTTTVHSRTDGMRSLGKQKGGRWIVPSGDGRRVTWDVGGGVMVGKVRGELV